jgi:hypothetical protein
MNRIIVLSAAVLLIIGAAIYQGSNEGRWGAAGANAEVQAFAARLDNVPYSIGDWEGKDDDVDPQILQVAGVEGAVSRTYKHRYTPDTVSIFLVCANRRAVSTHTPDKCYQANGFRVADFPQPYHLAASSLTGADKEKSDEKSGDKKENEVTLLNSAFVKETPSGTQRLRVFWAWSKDGDWIAPEGDARWALQGGDAWYKLYILTNEQADGRGNLQLDQSPCVKFARDFLPVAEAKLFEDAAPAAKPAAEQAAAKPSAQPTI